MLTRSSDQLPRRLQLSVPDRAWADDATHLSDVSVVLRQLATVGNTNKLKEQGRLTLESVIVGVWTAFEVAVGDLFEKSLNELPACVAGIGENLTGTKLKERFQLSGLGGIRDAYAAAWPNGGTLDALNRHEITTPYQLRNVLVHEAGIVTVKAKKVFRLDKALKSSKAGSPVDCDGVTAKRLSDASIAVCVKLMDFVDKWINTKAK